NDHTDEIYYNTSDQHSNINNINNFSLYKSNYSYSLGNEILTAQETNNQQQTQFTPIQPNLPVVPKEIPSLPIPEDKPETKPTLAPEQNKQVLRILMRSLLDNSASRYPFFVNTSDKLIINPRNFQP
ncbi:MAG: hypothetical protein ACK5RD_21465, partial [Aphanizomenon sp.]